MRALLVVALASCGGHASSPVPPQVANHPTGPQKPVTPAVDAVLAWPVAPFTAAQIAEVKSCDTGKLGIARYPKTLEGNGLVAAFAAQTTCDRATLAATCAERTKEGALVTGCLDAYRAVVTANAAFVFANALTGGYFGKVALVAPPPIASHALASVKLDYEWSGLGTGVKWTFTAHDLATNPAIDLTGASPKGGTKWTTEVAAAVTGFGGALTSFVPIAKPLNAVDCTDNYPDWSAVLTFDDGQKLELSTHASNLLGLGGPWQLTTNGVTYLQVGPEFTKAIIKLVKALDLPLGEPEGEMCRGFDLQTAILG
jgi:hypothetical protein